MKPRRSHFLEIAAVFIFCGGMIGLLVNHLGQKVQSSFTNLESETSGDQTFALNKQDVHRLSPNPLNIYELRLSHLTLLERDMGL